MGAYAFMRLGLVFASTSVKEDVERLNLGATSALVDLGIDVFTR